MSRQTIIQKATAEIGTKETPANSNKTKYGAWYGFDGYAWCAQFVSWVYDQAGHPLGKIDDAKGYRSCHSAYLYFKATGRITKKPETADIVIYDWDGDGHSDHTGIFHSWIKEGSTFRAIEGNTAKGNDSDGGEVMLRERNVQSVKAFVSPAVLGGKPVSIDETLTKGVKGSDVTSIQKMLYDLGYKITVDGFFGPETKRIVKQFQLDNKLKTDGLITPSLKGILEQALVKKAASDSKITTGVYLKKGSVGVAVVTLQKALIKKGYILSADGVFGDETVTVLKKFQSDNSLTIDGVAGPQTLGVLGIE